MTWRHDTLRLRLEARARMLATIRAFFADRGVLEVETPILSPSGVTDPAIDSLRLEVPLPDGSRWLQTSPEFPMKRLLAAGSGPIYQICKVFRAEELGRRHRPEFTMLEWYRPGWTLEQLIEEVADLVGIVLNELAGAGMHPASENLGTGFHHSVSKAGHEGGLKHPGLQDRLRQDYPLEHWTYGQLFQQFLEIDPWKATSKALFEAASTAGIGGIDQLDLDRDGWLDLLLSHCIEPALGQGRMSFVRDYPPSQAALAQIARDAEGKAVAERFELYLEGMEIANGFQELTDASEQRRRFEQDRAERLAAGRDCPPIDDAFLSALESGLPETAGVALGLDRLLMVATGSRDIFDVFYL